jgi:SHS2 domain-containing protein
MFELFEHYADVGIRGKGETIEKAFEEAAKAMFSVMVELDSVEKKESVEIKAEAGELDLLLVEWLNALLSESSLRSMVFGDFRVETIEQLKDGKWIVKGKAWGEKLVATKHSPKVEVKAATYSQLIVEKHNGLWLAQCVVDV